MVLDLIRPPISRRRLKFSNYLGVFHNRRHELPVQSYANAGERAFAGANAPANTADNRRAVLSGQHSAEEEQCLALVSGFGADAHREDCPALFAGITTRESCQVRRYGLPSYILQSTVRIKC